MTNMISISGLTKSYQRKPVLNDINLAVKAGQIMGLVGPNGAGKSTCLQALLGLISFDGEINVLGHQPRKNRETGIMETKDDFIARLKKPPEQATTVYKVEIPVKDLPKEGLARSKRDTIHIKEFTNKTLVT